MHCKVIVCQRSDASSKCTKGCPFDRRRRSVVSDHVIQQQLSLGPLQIVSSRTGDDEVTVKPGMQGCSACAAKYSRRVHYRIVTTVLSCLHMLHNDILFFPFHRFKRRVLPIWFEDWVARWIQHFLCRFFHYSSTRNPSDETRSRSDVFKLHRNAGAVVKQASPRRPANAGVFTALVACLGKGGSMAFIQVPTRFNNSVGSP